MTYHRLRKWLLLAIVLPGCAPLELEHGGKSPLAAAQMSPDSVVLDFFFIRRPLGDPAINGELWQDLDEQRFPPELRRELAENGFRVGLVGTRLPKVLEDLMELKEADAGPESAAPIDEPSGVRRRHLQLRSGRRTEIVASGVYDQLPKLVQTGGELRGRTYAQGQGILAIRASASSDGHARLELVPEPHHGESKQQWVAGDDSVAGDAAWQLDTARPKEVLGSMRLEADLAAGQMLVLTSLPQRPGSLGHYFFTEQQGGMTHQKLLLVRLSQTQRDDLFDAEWVGSGVWGVEPHFLRGAPE